MVGSGSIVSVVLRRHGRARVVGERDLHREVAVGQRDARDHARGLIERQPCRETARDPLVRPRAVGRAHRLGRVGHAGGPPRQPGRTPDLRRVVDRDVVVRPARRHAGLVDHLDGHVRHAGDPRRTGDDPGIGGDREPGRKPGCRPGVRRGAAIGGHDRVPIVTVSRPAGQRRQRDVRRAVDRQPERPGIDVSQRVVGADPDVEAADSARRPREGACVRVDRETGRQARCSPGMRTEAAGRHEGDTGGIRHVHRPVRQRVSGRLRDHEWAGGGVPTLKTARASKDMVRATIDLTFTVPRSNDRVGRASTT